MTELTSVSADCTAAFLSESEVRDALSNSGISTVVSVEGRNALRFSNISSEMVVRSKIGTVHVLSFCWYHDDCS